MTPILPNPSPTVQPQRTTLAAGHKPAGEPAFRILPADYFELGLALARAAAVRAAGGRLMPLCFELTMPRVGSWNGRWSGEDRYYAVLRAVGRSKAATEKAADLDGKSFYHTWEDGWGASVKVRLVAGDEAAKIRRNSAGFCGYEWMVDSILNHGRIQYESGPSRTVVR